MVNAERRLRRDITHIRIPQRLPLLPSRKYEVDFSAAPTHRSVALSQSCSHILIDFSQRAFAHRRQAEQNARETVQALRTEIGVRYSADVPMDQVDIVDWCVSQLEECGKKAGMETFKEAGTDGKIALILGGKVLVVDIELAVDRSDETRPKLSVIALKTSYASPASGATTEGSVSMNGFLMDHIQEFIVETHKPLGEQDTKKAGKLIREFLAHMRYLMKLDGMASQEGDGGLRWFNNIDVLALTAEGRAKSEAQIVFK